MKKKLLLLFLLVLSFIPFSVFANTYTYASGYLPVTRLRQLGLNINGDEFYVSTSQKHRAFTNFYFHQVNGKVALCAGIDKEIAYRNGVNLNIQNSFDSLQNNQGNLNDTQRELIKTLLANGQIYNGNIGGLMASKQEVFHMIALQIIAWEILENGRTAFKTTNSDPYAPSYNAANSAYQKIIVPNGRGVSSKDTLYYYYTKILDDCYKAMTKSEASAFNKSTYTLKWNGSKWITEVSGLGDYKTCSSDNSNVKIDSSQVQSGKIFVYTTKPKATATITCIYTTGNGTLGQDDKFYYYKFSPNETYCQNGVNCSCGTDKCQAVLDGTGIRTYSGSFKVELESNSIKIKKKNSLGEDLSGSKFTLQLKGSSDATITLEGNKDAKTLTKSGIYLLNESIVPSGYEGINEFEITIDALSNEVTKCDGEKKTNNKITSCLGDLVKVTYENKTIVLTVTNVGKNIKIKKENANRVSINGAKFNIKNSSGNYVNFKKDSSGIYNYTAESTDAVRDLYDSGSAIYHISGLPSGTYDLIELSVPSPYILPKEEDRVTKFQVDKSGNVKVYDGKNYNTVSDATVVVKNYTTDVTIIKDGDGNLLEGVKFLLYKEDKNTLVNSTSTSSGEYKYRADAEYTEYVTNSKGRITIRNLPIGKYYLREIATIPPYSLPEEAAAYLEIIIDVTKNGSTVNGSLKHELAISNTKNSFNFYKYDENGNYLPNARFKIQKYDSKAGKYIDIKVKSVENTGKYNPNADVFKPDPEGTIKFTLTNGIATFIDMEANSRYRVIETNAPKGYVLASKNEAPVVTIDEFGNSSGLMTLVNHKQRTNLGYAQAELIINISTGVDRVRYALIIGGVIVIVVVLIFASKKMDKNSKKDKK